MSQLGIEFDKEIVELGKKYNQLKLPSYEMIGILTLHLEFLKSKTLDKMYNVSGKVQTPTNPESPIFPYDYEESK